MNKINKILIELRRDKGQLLFVVFLAWLCSELEGIIPSDPNVSLASVWGAAIVGTASLVGGLISSNAANKSADKANKLAAANMEMQNELAKEALKDQRLEAAKMEKQKNVYRNMEFSNPYENMENVYEDLTVNQDQANFQKQMFQQSQSNIMGGLRGAAGSSGIAGLAQALANQGQQASQQSSLSIGQQERANELAKLGESKSNDLAFRSGEAGVEEKEMSRQATLLGMQMGQLSGANNAMMQSQSNQMAAGAAQANMFGQQSAAQYGMAGQMLSTGMKTLGDADWSTMKTPEWMK